MSEKQIPTASTLTRSWVGPGAATILARLWTSCPGPTIWIACWVAGSAGTSGGVWFTWRFLVAAGRKRARAGRPRMRWMAVQLSITWPPVTGRAWPVSYRWATR